MNADQFCFSHLENELHRNFAESLTNSFVQIDDLLQRLDAYCANQDINTPIAILGDVGSGKSALLASWVRNRHNVSHDDEQLFYHAIGCSRLSCQVSHLLRRLANWLLQKFDLKDAIDLSSDDKLPWILSRVLEHASKKGTTGASKKGTAVIVLDGLQHIKGRGLKWLPSKLPPNVRLIVSSSVSSRGDIGAPTSEHFQQQQAKTQQIYDEIERRNWQMLLMNPLSEESVKIIVAKNLCFPPDIEEHDGIVDDLCSHPNANNPSFLTGMLRGVSSSVSGRDDLEQYLSCKNTTDLIERMITQFDSEMQGYGLGDSLSLLFIARHGLHEEELFALLERIATRSLCDEDKKLLVEKLSNIGVVRLDTQFGQLFTLPANNPTLRNVVWNKFITTTTRETEVRSLIVEYFESKDPSLRYCEELPWQQEKNQCPNLGRTLVDLRVLDIMFNADEMKNELFTYLSRLVLSNNWDIVSNFNRAVEKWNAKQKPTSTQLSMMCIFLADVMMWFSNNVSQHADMPPFMRDSLQVDHLLYDDVSDPARVLLSFPSASVNQTQSVQHYFYYRWLWCNWPWIALRVASKSLKLRGSTDSDPTPSTVSVMKGSEEDAIGLESTVRERAMTRTPPLPASLLTKLEKLTSHDSQTQKETSTTVIPFSTSRYQSRSKTQEEVPRTSYSLEQKERDAKELLDALKTERAKRESTLHTLQADKQLASVSLDNSRHHQEQRDSVTLELKSRCANVRDLYDKAASIESSFTEILSALEAYNPANSRRHDEMEHQISLSMAQLRDLQNERAAILERINQTRSEALSVKSLIKSTMEERGEIEPLLASLRYQAKENEERLKSALVKKFDSAAFSKRVQLVGKIAKRRQDKLKHVTVASQSEVSIEDHPMMRLMRAFGMKNAQEIATKLQRGEEEAETLRKRQESFELQLTDKRSRLERLHYQMKELGLADSFSCRHGSPSHMEMETTEMQRRENQLAVISNLTTNVNIALLHLHQKVQLMRTECSADSIPSFMDEVDSNLHRDAKRVASLVLNLFEDNTTSSQHTNETPVKYENIRVLNKSEIELRSAEQTRSEVPQGPFSGGEGNLEELVEFIDQSLSHEALAEQRRVNLLSRSKQGRNTSKGLILDKVLGLK